MVETTRKCIPTSYEIACKNSMNRKNLHVDLGLKEFSFVKIFSDEEIISEEFDKNLLKDDFRNFCKDNSNLIGFFYPQFTAKKKLTDYDLEVIDYVQEIEETNIRLLHFKNNISFEEFQTRVESFMTKNINQRIIPVLEINCTSNRNLILLGQKAEYLGNKFKECIINYSNWKIYDQAWKIVSSMLNGTNWYVFKLPTNEHGGYSLMIFCFLIGANATCHKLYRGGGGGKINPPLFLNSDMSLRPLESCDKGIAKYGTRDRINFLIEDGRKSYLRAFAKWDRVVQANAFCNALRNISKLQNVESIKHAQEYFGQ